MFSSYLCQILTGKTSSSTLLLLKGEFTSHVSLSQTSLKLPPSESESFKISLILWVPIKFLWNIFWTRTRSGIFHNACNARTILWLFRTHWYFRPACLERRHNGSLRLMAGVSCHKTKTWIESNVTTACCATVPSQSPAYATKWLAGRWKESLELHTWRSLKYKPEAYNYNIFFNKLMKIGKY